MRLRVLASLMWLLCGWSVGSGTAQTDVSPLMTAVRDGQLQKTRELLQAGTDPNLADDFGETALMVAVTTGNVQIVIALLDFGASMESVDQNGDSPLAYAVASDQGPVVDLLLQRGADVDQPNLQGATPVQLAVSFAHINVVRALIAKGADVNRQNDAGATALLAATVNGRTDVVGLLLREGAEVDVAGRDGWTPWMHAIGIGLEDLADTLEAAGAHHADSTERAIREYTKGLSYAVGRRVGRAITLAARARTIDPTLPSSSGWLANVCWSGTLYHDPDAVAEYCEASVALDTSVLDNRDNRGVNRGMRGDLAGAAEDFAFIFAELGDEEALPERRTWLTAIEAGEDPFTIEVVDALRYPWYKGSVVEAARELGYELMTMIPGLEELPQEALLLNEEANASNGFMRVYTADEPFPIGASRFSSVVYNVTLAGTVEQIQQSIQEINDAEPDQIGDGIVRPIFLSAGLTPDSILTRPVTIDSLAGPISAWRSEVYAADTDDDGLPEEIELHLVLVGRERVVGNLLVMSRLGETQLEDILAMSVEFEQRITARMPSTN